MGRDRKGFKKSPEIDLGFLGEHVGFQVHIARRALRQAMRAFRPAYDLPGGGTPPPSGTMSSLALIGFNPGISQQEIAAALFLDPSKATVLIKNVASAGLIEKRRAEDDRRRIALYLTAEGREMLEKIGMLSAAQEDRIGRGLSPVERRQLIALLIKLQDTLR
ncbi:MAG: winged helix-turn-helix transcriptional regulator [Sphingobium sp.]|nr:winged helix-turn-helix transcriptional regulator [Sphingobium sp.]